MSQVKSAGAKGAPPAGEETIVRKPITPAGDLAEIEQLTLEPVICDVLVRGTPFRFEGRRLLPFEVRDVKLILSRAIPPVVAGTGPGDERLNYADETFQAERETHRRQARALVLWLAFPNFKQRAEKRLAEQQVPLPAGREQIAEFIEHLNLDDDVLEQIYRQVTEDIGDLQKFISFTLGSEPLKG